MKDALYFRIYETIAAQITGGELPPGARIPTEMEITELYATSRITASRAVRELEQRGYVYRVRARGTFVNEASKWQTVADQSDEHDRGLISIVFPSPVSGISLNVEVLQGAETASSALGYTLSVTSVKTEDDSTTRKPIDIEKDLIAQVIDRGARGAIIYPYSSRGSAEIYNRMTIRGFPFVTVDRRVLAVEAPGVASDNRGGFRSVVEHVIAAGHRRIAFVSGNTFASSSRADRFAGFIDAMNAHRIAVNDDYIVHDLIPFDYNKVFFDPQITGNDTLHRSIKTLLERFIAMSHRPTAICATNDYIALSMLNIAAECGIRVPQDLSITGFDNLSVCTLFKPRLTTVAQPFRKMGEEAVRLLHAVMADPQRRRQSIALPTTLVPGDSVRDGNRSEPIAP